MKDFIITKCQIEQLRPYMEDVEKKIELGYNKFLDELLGEIAVNLGWNYEDTKESDELEQLYYEIMK